MPARDRPNRRLPASALALGAAVALSLGLGGCEKGKPRHPPPDPMAAAPPPVEEAPMPKPLSAGLAKRPEAAGFFLDHAGAAFDPFNKPPAVTPRDRPVVFDGFGFDSVTKRPAAGVDMVVDGKAYGTAYGAPRQDVASYFNVVGLVNVGFRTVLPAGTLSSGPHVAIVRVVATDGRGYYDSPPIPFTVD
ncbi:MAG: hypothetical protein JSS35_17540 [Proteobacteria bacterium]|nr:hypothetical protein [Pseudomonadota bacterium]